MYAGLFSDSYFAAIDSSVSFYLYDIDTTSSFVGFYCQAVQSFSGRSVIVDNALAFQIVEPSP
jgi:hypothetical protein